MAYSLKRECAVILNYKGRGYRLNALSSFDFSQTFARSTGSRKTLHSKVANPYVLVNRRNSASFNCDILLTDNFVEGVLLELAGFESPSGNVFHYSETMSVAPEKCDIFIVSESVVFKISDASIQSLTLPMAKGKVPAINVNFTGSYLSKQRGVDLSAGIVSQGNPLIPTPIQYTLDSQLYNHILNTGMSIQQNITWRDDRGIHNIGDTYIPKESILTGRSIGINATLNHTSESITDTEPFLSDVKIYQSGVTIHASNSLITPRIEVDDVFQEAHDISITNTTRNIKVEFGGLIHEQIKY